MNEESKAKLAAINGMTIEEMDALDAWYEEHKHEVKHDERFEVWKRYVESIQAIYLEAWQMEQMSRDIKPEQWKTLGQEASIDTSSLSPLTAQYLKQYPTWVPKRESE